MTEGNVGSCDYVSNLSLNSNKKLDYFQIKDKSIFSFLL